MSLFDPGYFVLLAYDIAKENGVGRTAPLVHEDLDDAFLLACRLRPGTDDNCVISQRPAATSCLNRSAIVTFESSQPMATL